MERGKHSIGFLENFGADIGAFASTWSFHENNLIVLGSNDSDMAIASNHLIKNQGGLVVVKIWKNTCFTYLYSLEELFQQILLKLFHLILKRSIIPLWI